MTQKDESNRLFKIINELQYRILEYDKKLDFLKRQKTELRHSNGTEHEIEIVSLKIKRVNDLRQQCVTLVNLE